MGSGDAASPSGLPYEEDHCVSDLRWDPNMTRCSFFSLLLAPVLVPLLGLFQRRRQYRMTLGQEIERRQEVAMNPYLTDNKAWWLNEETLYGAVKIRREMLDDDHFNMPPSHYGMEDPE